VSDHQVRWQLRVLRASEGLPEWRQRDDQSGVRSLQSPDALGALTDVISYSRVSISMRVSEVGVLARVASVGEGLRVTTGHGLRWSCVVRGFTVLIASPGFDSVLPLPALRLAAGKGISRMNIHLMSREK